MEHYTDTWQAFFNMKREIYNEEYFAQYLKLKKEYNELIEDRMNRMDSMSSQEVTDFEDNEIDIRKRVSKLKKEFGIKGVEKPQGLRRGKGK